MNITRETIKSTLRNIMAEESEYQTFFKKALEKAGKSIPSMSDEEKKEFFNKIDAAWNAKGEKKNEGNAFGAAVVAAKEKGEDEFEVGGKTYKVESVNEAVSKTFKYKTQKGDIHIEIEEDPAGVMVDVIFNKVDLTTTDIQFPVGDVVVTQRKKNVKLKESVNEGIKYKDVKKGDVLYSWVYGSKKGAGREYFKVKILEPISDEPGYERFHAKQLDGLRKGKTVVVWLDTLSKKADESVNESDVKKKVNRRGDVDGLLVKHNGKEYEIVYSGDFDMGGAVEPYGIVMPEDDVVSFLGKDKKAKSIWKQLKPKVDKFLKSNESVNEAAANPATKKFLKGMQSIKVNGLGGYMPGVRNVYWDKKNKKFWFVDFEGDHAELLNISTLKQLDTHIKKSNIKLESVNEEFTAVSNKSGKTVVFKDKDSRDAAVKAGTHSDDEKDGDTSMGGEKPNMFSKDTGYDAGGDSEPKKKTGLSGFIQRMRDKQKEKELADRRYPDFKKDAIIVSAIDKNGEKQEWMTKMSREEITAHMNQKVEDGEAKSYQLMRFNYYYRPVPIDESAGCGCGCNTCSDSVNEINEAASDRDFEKVFNLFNKKDYFHLKGSIKTMLGNWQRALDKGDKGAAQYTKQDVIDSVTAQTKARAKQTYDELVKAINKKDINALKSKLRHDQKFSLAIFTQVTGKKLPKSTRDIHSFLDNEFMGESMVKEDENPCWKGYKQIGMKDKNGREVPNCVPESVQSVNEGRAFINAARKAKEEGKTEFEFNGKTYPVTLKEETINERRLGKVSLLRTVEKGDSSYVEGVKISPELAFELRMFLERPMLARTRTGIAIDNAQMKDALGMLAKVGVQKRLSSGVRKEFDNLLNKYNK